MDKTDNSITNYNHGISVIERKNIIITGVKKIDNFDRIKGIIKRYDDKIKSYLFCLFIKKIYSFYKIWYNLTNYILKDEMRYGTRKNKRK